VGQQARLVEHLLDHGAAIDAQRKSMFMSTLQLSRKPFFPETITLILVVPVGKPGVPQRRPF
jgi:hypothetical protein